MIDSYVLEVGYKWLSNMFRLSSDAFHGLMRISWVFLARVLWEISCDQEHELLVSDLCHECCLQAFK
jgi:hypothetical protein